MGCHSRKYTFWAIWSRAINNVLKNGCLCATSLNVTKFSIKCQMQAGWLIFFHPLPAGLTRCAAGTAGLGWWTCCEPFSSHPSSLITSSSPTSLATTHTSSQSHCPCRHSMWPGHSVPLWEQVNDKYSTGELSIADDAHQFAISIKWLQFTHSPIFIMVHEIIKVLHVLRYQNSLMQNKISKESLPLCIPKLCSVLGLHSKFSLSRLFEGPFYYLSSC